MLIVGLTLTTVYKFITDQLVSMTYFSECNPAPKIIYSNCFSEFTQIFQLNNYWWNVSQYQ